jgi:hypothetical protein
MRRRLIFDTSAINRLLTDPDREALIAGCRSAYFVRITETNCIRAGCKIDQQTPRERRLSAEQNQTVEDWFHRTFP